MDPAVFIPALGVYGILLARLVARIRDEEKGYGKEKTACSMGFVALAAIAALAGSRPRAFRQLLPALLLCLAGDVILALYNHDRRPGLFLGGLVSFLGGHAFFIWGLCRVQPLGWPVFLAALLGGCGVLALSRLPCLKLGKMLPWTVVYGGVVSALVGKACQLAFGMGELWCFLVLAGAVLFWISDLLILFLYFWPGRHPRIHAANLITYYLAMAFLAVSLGF